jgi:alcohol dehydrogenase
MTPFDAAVQVRLIFGAGAARRLGEIARLEGFRRTLLVADAGLRAAGHVDVAARSLEREGIEVFRFHDFDENPDSAMVENGRAVAAPLGVDSIVGLGGGSSMDCAKGINFVLTNGGRMEDYQGYGKPSKPMLPMIAVPTTTGTGSEAQSHALISNAATHEKMACGDRQAAFRAAILDPELAVSQPEGVRASAGYDALSHAAESYVTTRRNALSMCYAREAWRLLEANYERLMARPGDIEVVGAMQLGAFFAGAAIENSMLGAAHACANPLTARYGTPHGTAIALMLAPVARWNGAALYGDLHPEIDRRLDDLASAGGLPRRLRDASVAEHDLPALAADAARQWTGQFNPRPFDEAGALEVYQCAY